MDVSEKEDLKQKIIAAIAETEEKIHVLKKLTKPISPENAIGRVSRMDAINNKSVNEAALINTENKLKKLLLSMEKINDPGFGNCARCENPIPIARLMLMPESNKCVHCADR